MGGVLRECRMLCAALQGVHSKPNVFILCSRNRFSFRGNSEMSQTRPAQGPAAAELVVDFYRIGAVFLETKGCADGQHGAVDDQLFFLAIPRG